MKKDKTKGWYGFFRMIVYLVFFHLYEMVKEQLRKIKIIRSYISLEKYRDRHKGKRCFIVATGPSLTQDDFLSLKDEVTIGVNGLCLWFEEMQQETNYFLVSDDDVYARVADTLGKTKKSEVFISERIRKTQKVNKKFILFPVDIWNRFISSLKMKKFSRDFSICSYDEETVVFHALQLAVYMGCSEIYLLGTDCNYKQPKAYAVDHGKKVDQDVGNKMIETYKIVKRYEQKYNFKVFNATRGGMLEVFPRVCLDELLK